MCLIWLGDSAGSFTCFKYNGNSVVDYFICNAEAVNQVMSMQALDHTHLSDHSPVSLCLWTCFTSKDKINVPSTYAAPFRYQISSGKLNVFKNDISSKEVEGKIQSLKSMMTGEVGPRTLQIACDSITALINSIASKHFKKHHLARTIGPLKTDGSIWNVEKLSVNLPKNVSFCRGIQMTVTFESRTLINEGSTLD